MRSTQFLTAAVVALGFVSQGLAQNNGGNGGNNGGNNGQNANGGNNGGNNGQNAQNNNGGNAGNNGGADPLLLLQDNVQDASNSEGQPDAAAGQSNSNTDPANFINHCTGKTLTNGKQVTQGSCNGVVMGDIPSNNNMISAIVINPAPNDDLDADTDFDVQVQLQNLVAGSFTDPINTYYSAPQELQGGNVIGHCHVTIQDLNNNIAPQQPPDPKLFAFFKGINDDGNGQGLLSATVGGGLPAGTYRVCTMNSASNHQPVLMPVAQRGAQDDCTKFTVGQGGGNGGNGGNNAGGNNNAGNGQGNAGGNGGNGQGGNAAATSAADGAAATDAAGAGGNNGGNGGNGGNGQGGNGGNAAATSAADGAAATTDAAGAGATGGGQGGGNGGNGQGGNGGQGGNRGGRFGRGRFGRGRKFAARDFIA